LFTLEFVTSQRKSRLTICTRFEGDSAKCSSSGIKASKLQLSTVTL